MPASASADAGGTRTVSGAVFDWGLNNETNGGAYFGGCNFLSAGIAGDTGSARLWAQGDGFYKTRDGNTTIVRPTANGQGVAQPSWATKCQTPSGASVNGKTTNAADSYTQTRVQIANGTGVADADADTAQISWEGSFTVAYYGGMTYWSASDPVLTVEGGVGTITATLSGYGTDMDDMSIWKKLTPREVTIATLTGVDVTAEGLVVTPDYLGVSIPSDVAGRNPQAARTSDNAAWWGSFPADFLRFQVDTGQNSYWFTTDGGANTIQPRKVTQPVTVGYALGDLVGDAPTITGHPATQTVAEGATAAFQVRATGTDLAYQWQRTLDGTTWTDIAGATSASYSLTAAADADGSQYRVRVSNPVAPDGVLSRAATLNVAVETPSPSPTPTPTPTSTPTQTPTPTPTPTPDDDADPDDADPSTSDDGPLLASGVVFDWGLNDESNGGAYFGGCNFLSAGVAGNTGSARLWAEGDGFYRTEDGNTALVRPTADGADLTQPTWATKCENPAGTTVNGKTDGSDPATSTQTRVQISEGSGIVDPAAEDADISWDGSFTVAYYGGMTYWSVTDPRLVVEDGKGTVTATLSGYGTDMDDMSIWTQIPPREVVIATLTDVDVTAEGFVVTPDYLGVSIPDDIAGRNDQAARTSTNESWWGAFPAEFLRFQQLTGQNSYWFTTDGGANTIQPRKVTLPLTVEIASAEPAPRAPEIARQPQDRTATEGTDVVFSVTATGADLEYQWSSSTDGENWEDVAGATESAYRVTADADLDGTSYRVRVSNELGDAESDPASLTVVPADTDDQGTVPGDDEPVEKPDEGKKDDEDDETVDASGALFDWGLNNESNGGAYFGGCNFLSAGIAGDTGSARLWTEADGFYKTRDGNTTIVQPGADGESLVQPDWDSKCDTPTGSTVNGKTTAAADTYTQTRVRIAGGTGSLDAEANTAELSWEGSFTVAYYGGMTYWSASDPKVVVEADGSGTVTATLSGYGADMDDMSKWSRLAEREVVIATLSGVKVTEKGLTVTPDYLGVSVPEDVAGRNAQAQRTSENESWWGAFPADFVRFQTETGQSSYWYTTEGSAGTIQPRKVPLPLTVCATADCSVTSQAATSGPASIDIVQQAIQPPGAPTPPRALTAPEAQAVAVAGAAAPVPAAEQVVVMQRQAAPIVGDGGAADRRALAALALIGALGMLTLAGAVGGTLFATGSLGATAPSRAG
ncbi:hypothetical protein GCM10022202_34150 [Microbacterium marinilacus]|uniref:Ig-like domain-containing protein n=1 Tax=Microbacterium marinilacus TaxID=415209 RepID=A0ABP7BWD1_9MICO